MGSGGDHLDRVCDPHAEFLVIQVRKIIHLDMDAFYASIEERERPELKGQPLAVGGGSRRGVVTTCNYAARQFGVRSAMPGFLARERCPHLIFLPVRFDLYREESRKIRELMVELTPLVEPLSLDEAYLDVTDSQVYAWKLAKQLRRRIQEVTGLTASAGVAPNKMLAKIASDWKKPNGQFAVLPEQVEAFMAELPVRKVWGIGPKSAGKFEQRGIRTCGDLQQLTLPELAAWLGKWGEELYHLCRGNDDRPVQPNRIRKSLSNERTYSDHLTNLKACQAALEPLVQELQEELRAKAADRIVHKAFVIVKFSDFQRTTKECVSPGTALDTFEQLLAETYSRGNGVVRLLGAGVRFQEVSEELNQDLEQPWLFPEDGRELPG